MSDPIPDLDVALTQMQAERPDGPWAVCTLTEGHIFTDPVQARVWMEQENRRGRGVYWTRNPVVAQSGENGRWKKQDVPLMDRVFADLDLYKDKLCPDATWAALSIDQRKQRITAELKAGKHGPVPTWICDSGGGVHAIYRLEEPVPQQVGEEINCWLIQQLPFGDPGTHNADRILRMPGSVNWKKGDGRVPTLAGVLDANITMMWDGDFGRAKPKSSEKETVDIVLNAEDLDSLDDLQVRERTKDIVRDGRLPEPKEGDDSGSAWMWDCMLGLLREGVDPNLVLGILLDTRYGIGDVVAKKWPDIAEREYQAARQVRRALGHLAAERKNEFPDDADDVVAAHDHAAPEQPVDLDAHFDDHTVAIGHRDLKALPRTPWLIEALLLYADISIIAGRGGAGKSTHAWHVAVSVATGKPFAWWPAPERARKVLVISGEDDDAEIERRVAVACQSMGVSRPDLGENFIVWKERNIRLVERNPATGEVKLTRLYHTMKRAIATRDFGLVIIDPLIKVSTGYDENSNSEQEDLLGLLRGLVVGHQCAMLIDDHASKMGGTRGASSKVDFGRVNIELAPMTLKDWRRLKPPRGAEAYVSVVTGKQNYAPRGGEQWLMFDERDVGNGERRAALKAVDLIAGQDYLDPETWPHFDAFMRMLTEGRPDGKGRWSSAKSGNRDARLDSAVAESFDLTLKQARQWIEVFHREDRIREAEMWDPSRNKMKVWEINPDFEDDEEGTE